MEDDHTYRTTLNRDSRTDAIQPRVTTGVTRRQALRMGCLLSAGGVLGATGIGAGRAASPASSDSGPEDVIHLEYDEYESWSDLYWLSNGDRDNLSFVSSPTYTGETALQLRVRDGDHWGASTHYDFEDDLLELNGRVHFALNSNWTMEDGGISNCRLWNCAMALGEGSAGGGVPDGTNGWSNRLYVTTRGTSPDGPFHLLSYTYHMDQNLDHDFILDGEEYAVQHPEIVPGKWYEFEYYVRVNTIDNGTANPDGVIQYWLDRDLIYDRRNFRFTEDHADNGIETNGPAGHYGGQYVAPQNLYAYYDDHSMALNGTFADAPDSLEESTRPDRIELPNGIGLPDWLELPTGMGR